MRKDVAIEGQISTMDTVIEPGALYVAGNGIPVMAGDDMLTAIGRASDFQRDSDGVISFDFQFRNGVFVDEKAKFHLSVLIEQGRGTYINADDESDLRYIVEVGKITSVFLSYVDSAWPELHA